MKKDKYSISIIITLITIPLILMFCCQDDDKKRENTTLSKTDKENISYDLADLELEDEGEKIMLLSFESKVPADSLHLILKEYYSKDLGSKDYRYLEKIIDTISIKYKKSKRKIASLIFQFKYEMRTVEEIGEKELESLESENIEEYKSEEGFGRGY